MSESFSSLQNCLLSPSLSYVSFLRARVMSRDHQIPEVSIVSAPSLMHSSFLLNSNKFILYWFLTWHHPQAPLWMTSHCLPLIDSCSEPYTSVL
jgi:hypothetical protein